MESSSDLPTWDGKILSLTAVSPINIALIKYWGKCDEIEIIPINSSLSITLNCDDLCSTTTVSLGESYEESELILNGKSEGFSDRIKRMLSFLTDSIPAEGAKAWDTVKGEEITIPKEDLLKMKVHVESTNNFPTASGVASSSSGLSCLALCLNKVYGCEMDLGECSRLARLGSGSACRSLFGGFVIWDKGFDLTNFEDIRNITPEQVLEASKNSKAIQVKDESHWDEIALVICVATSEKKKIASTKGMKDSVDTSEFLAYRATNIVPKRLENITKAIEDKDWNTFTEIIIKESNSLHASCLDTYPPIFYMNETTKNLASLTHDINQNFYEPVAAYTVDAGANCFLITKKKHLNYLIDLVSDVAGLDDSKIKFNFKDEIETEHNQIDGDLISKTLDPYRGKIELQQLIVTRVGKGCHFVAQ
ncbi:unnamed protein product [Moneuplotes crassus]|uniref:Diphosphomevalonate decarboxylase n=1 Tax=Euplotes crassus TaxID=5936 RepID=A0AAD1USV0_EUPCR|nr:unnamed protein product [Moneuplotes crassus]